MPAPTTPPRRGVSVNAVLPVVAKKVDIVITTLAGRGIGRYSTTATGRDLPAGWPLAAGPWATQARSGIETHPTPKLDFNVYLGDEYIGSAVLHRRNHPAAHGVGYGLISANLSGCQVEIPSPDRLALLPTATSWRSAPVSGTASIGGRRVRSSTECTIRINAVPCGRETRLPPARLSAVHRRQQHEILTAVRWYFP